MRETQESKIITLFEDKKSQDDNKSDEYIKRITEVAEKICDIAAGYQTEPGNVLTDVIYYTVVRDVMNRH